MRVFSRVKVKAGALALACGLLLAGCGGDGTGSSRAEASAEGAVAFTDALGREVSVSEPQRVAALIGSFADIWCLAGGKDTLAAAAGDAWTQFDLDLPETVADLGAVKSPSIETLLAAGPDFVIGSANTAADVELMELMDELGIPAACFEVTSFDDYLEMLGICTRITGDAEAYRLHGEAVQEQVEAARARADGSSPTVLYIRATGSSCKVKGSEGSVLGEMLADLGCENIADSETGLLESLSLETIVAADPDYIFAVLQGEMEGAQAMLAGTLLDNPAWEGLTAVKEGRFYLMDQQLYNLKPNARWGEAYEGLADFLYPEE